MNAKRDELFKKILSFEKELRYSALFFTKNIDDANDLLQSTYVKVIENYEMYRDDNNLKSWVFTVMKNIFINEYRRKIRRGVVYYDNPDVYIEAGDSYNGSDMSVLVGDIESALGNISKRNRDVLKDFLAGYSYEEIAFIQDTPMGTVKSRIFLGRKMLAEVLEDMGLLRANQRYRRKHEDEIIDEPTNEEMDAEDSDLGDVNDQEFLDMMLPAKSFGSFQSSSNFDE